jgi:hypothetical protein
MNEDEIQRDNPIMAASQAITEVLRDHEARLIVNPTSAAAALLASLREHGYELVATNPDVSERLHIMTEDRVGRRPLRAIQDVVWPKTSGHLFHKMNDFGAYVCTPQKMVPQDKVSAREKKGLALSLYCDRCF